MRADEEKGVVESENKNKKIIFFFWRPGILAENFIS